MSQTSLDFTRKTAKRMLSVLGYRIVQEPTAAEYGKILPGSEYCPWNTDPRFIETFREIHAHTLVDKYRCWELWSLISQVSKLSGAIMEVGVWRGGTGALMARRAALEQIKDPLYLCDTFRGVPKAGALDTYYKGGEHADTSQAIVSDLLQSMGLWNVRLVPGLFPEESAELLPGDVRFRLVHIDVDTYESGRDVTKWVWSRMVTGGILVYDDYGFKVCDGIRKLVDEQSINPDSLVLYNLNGHAITIKLGN